MNYRERDTEIPKRSYMLIDAETIAELEQLINNTLDDIDEIVYNLYGDLIIYDGKYHQALLGEWVWGMGEEAHE